jgi:large subunit ribosomal protein L24e
MVIKTDTCEFSELRIYPGRGSHFAARDGKVHFFISSKTRSLFHQRIKPVKLTWTQASRRFNKKTKIVDIQKKRTKKTTRVQKAVVGMSLDEIKRKRSEEAAIRDKTLEATKKELKERSIKKAQAKKAEKAKTQKAGAANLQKAPAVNKAKAPKAKPGKK